MAVRTFRTDRPDGFLCLDADEALASTAESLLAHLVDVPGEDLADDFRVDLGWSLLTVEREGDGWRLRGPDVTGADPSVSVDDVTPHLLAPAEQARVAALLGLPPEPIRFDDEIAVEHGALETEAIYLRRLAADDHVDADRPASDSGWYLGPLTAEASDDIHLHPMPAYQVVRTVPAVAGFLALPADYLVGVVGGGIDAVFNAAGKRVIGAGGELRIEARPELVERAAKELELTAPEVVSHSRHHPVHGYFLVWRDTDDPAMVVVHPNGEQLRLPTLVHPDRVEQHWTDGDRTPPGYVLG